MIDSLDFFIIWLSFLIIVICAVTPFLIWAIRSGQFAKFDYAARLPLKGVIVENESGDKKTKSSCTGGGNEDVSA
jgi:nitrogen fixation-related uncharacterized protein